MRYQLKCTTFNFGWGSAPDPAGGAYSSPPDPLAGFTGAYFKGRGQGMHRRGRKGKSTSEHSPYTSDLKDDTKDKLMLDF